MKTAFYVDDGREQIVLTPESDFEKGILGKLREAASNPSESPRKLAIEMGDFYACAGGWTRHANHSRESLMIVLDPISSLKCDSED